MKTKRNDKCPCGSGLKYKKCCLVNKPADPMATIKQSIINKMQSHEKYIEHLKSLGIYINYLKPLYSDGKKEWVLGNTIRPRPEDQTFREFIIETLKFTLGKVWWYKNINTKEHFLMKCYSKYCDWDNKNKRRAKELNKVIFVKPDGWTKYISAVAFDVCSLIHTYQLPNHLLKRLRDINEYQGAQYEIMIAAIFARLNCEIKYLDDDKQAKKHCEFYAIHRETGVKVAIEAKSRHRKGVIHQGGERENHKIVRGDITELLKDALLQAPENMPYIIFIDLNTPINRDVDIFKTQWFQDIKNDCKKYGVPTIDKPAVYNYIFFTNYSYHFEEENEWKQGTHIIEVPFYTKIPLPTTDLINMLSIALKNYGVLPNIDDYGNVNC